MQAIRQRTEIVFAKAEVLAYVELHRRELLELLDHRETAGVAFARRHARVMDGLVASIFQAIAACLGHGAAFPIVLGAVGGYGRGLLGWKSDLDVRLVTDADPERARQLAERLFYPLWDAGVSIGHQVCTVSDLLDAARNDLPTATSLLDFHVLAGDEGLAQGLDERAFAGIFSEAELPAFLERLDGEVSERHKRFGDSVYLLEPDVKSGAGGLRDIDIALWAARARFRTKSVDDLKTVGVLSGSEARELKAAKDFLWTLRNHLHRRANRRIDRLTFEAQEALSELMGYRERVAAPPGDADEQLGAMVEALMSDYYRHARVALRLREQIMARAMPPVHHRPPHVVDLDGGVQLFNGQVTVTRASDLESDPALALRLYSVAVERQTTLLPFARDLVIRATSKPAFCEALRQSPESAARFVSLVATRHEAPFRHRSVLAELHDTGILTAMIPEFLPVVGRVHHDVYHVYTVDVHSVAAVDLLHALARGEYAVEHPLASSLAADVAHPAVLYLATLLHDVGKAIGGKDHSQRGAVMARTILARLGLSREEIDDACELILQHLTLYRIAARRDLEDPATLSELARIVRDRAGLRHLFLLTVVDLSTTSPTSMTKWKRHMLDDVFRLTDELFASSSPSSSRDTSVVRRAVRAQWSSEEDTAFLDEYLDSMPDGYLRSNSPLEIALHARVALGAQESVVTAAIVPSGRAEATELCVVTGGRLTDPLCVIAKDQPGLLASISAAIAANGFDVHAAQIHTRQLSDGRVQAMDLFWVTSRVEEDFESTIDKLRSDLERVVTGALTPNDLLRGRRTRFSDRPVPAVATSVTVDNKTSATHTVVEIETRDRPGLLFTLAKTFHQLDLTIGVAKINTEGTRVLDVFHVTDLSGKKIDVSVRGEGVRRALLSALTASSPPVVAGVSPGGS